MPDFREIHITYDHDTDDTTVECTQEFLDLPLIHQADALQDAIAELTIIYNNTLDKTFKK